jgi:rhodanese-related sulfurtransferase
MGFFSNLFKTGPKVNYQELIDNGAVVIDVRTPAEFSAGHATGSQNIPLDQIPHKVGKIKKLNKTIIVCCRTGARSGQAMSMLKNKSVKEVYNANSWKNLVK